MSADEIKQALEQNVSLYEVKRLVPKWYVGRNGLL